MGSLHAGSADLLRCYCVSRIVNRWLPTWNRNRYRHFPLQLAQFLVDYLLLFAGLLLVCTIKDCLDRPMLHIGHINSHLDIALVLYP